MVLEIVANTEILNLACDACCFQDFGVANARKLEQLWRLNHTTRNDYFLLGIDRMFRSVVHECNALGNIAFKDYVCRQRLAKDFEIRAVLICLKITSGRIASLASVRARSCNQPYPLLVMPDSRGVKHVVFTKGVIKADMIATPRILGLLCHSSDFFTSFDNIGVERKLPVVEASPYGSTGSMVFSDKGHSATLLACQFLEKAMSVGKVERAALPLRYSHQ